MKEFISGPGLVGKIVEHDIPQPGLGQVVVKMAAAGVNPKDWKMVDYGGCTPNGSFAEYAVIEANAAWVLGPQTAFEEAATVPLNACTAATGLYMERKLPAPWLPAKEPTPLIVWGATSAVGAYAVQLAVKSNVHPIICVAGSSKRYLEDFIDRSQGDTILHYRDSEDDIKQGIRNAASGHTILHAIEGVSSERSAHIMAETMGTGGHIGLVLFEKEHTDIPTHITHNKYNVSVMHENEKDFGFRHEVVPGGLNGVITAFERLKAGQAHAVKYVIKL
ncbi:hypothetical protein COCC4DRAFT_57942 [Bipolaris maydis ATCC 48331]|uniref:Enoyl reductase (ER) domain-containing protein n=2 Tax=Cochliobolus heterostrophus TaxID=5016 RepID=M2UX78_COCH5|nr:uncharacterized protein COCC4DRAFT_57942 [Bipolaris maydis ATCC 48331]EMD92387.1 hypothetical protein COCHEDRAFT_1213444 [Bipolaris maydis C5]ENI08078.1 hypothetical protein COCC4DRAFT_57942 [Bipolaris maydis ATCC 48331]